MGPDIDDLVVALTIGHQTRSVLVLDLLDLFLGSRQQHFLLCGHDHVIRTDGRTGAGRKAEARVHELVSKYHGILEAQLPVTGVDQAGDSLLVQRGIHQRFERQALGDDVPQNGATHCRIINRRLGGETAVLLLHFFVDTHLDLGMQLRLPCIVYTVGFGNIGQHHAFSLGIDALTGHVVQTQHHVLGGHDDGLTVGSGQDVVARHHQGARFELSFQGKRHVHGHLVAVEVGVEGGTHQRMQLNGLALDEHGLERLDAQAVQSGRPVEHHRMFTDDVLQDVPDFRRATINQLLGCLDGGGQSAGLQLGEDKGLEQLQGHALGQAALVQFQGRADHDNGAAGVVHALAQQVLTEAALLALDHVSQGFQGPLVGAGDGAATAAVVQQSIHGFLQHALLVAHDDIRRGEFQQALEAVVAVDHPAVQVVQIRSGEAAAIQRDQRTQFRRQHRQHLENHPLGTVTGFFQGFEQLETLGDLLDLGLGIGGADLFAQAQDFRGNIQRQEQFVDGLGTHAGIELVTVLLDGFEVLLIVHELAAFEHGHAGIDDHVGFEVQDALDALQGHVQQQADA